MPRGKRTYIVALDVQECETEAEAIAFLNEMQAAEPDKAAVIYSVLGAYELLPVVRLEKAGSDD
jgi:hypothetical protein